MRTENQQKSDLSALCADILTWIAEDGSLLDRFCALSGLTPETIRQASIDSGFAAGILDFLMSHEPTLLAYCASRHARPETIVSAWRRASGETDYEGSI